jgi:hypothetical protein
MEAVQLVAQLCAEGGGGATRASGWTMRMLQERPKDPVTPAEQRSILRSGANRGEVDILPGIPGSVNLGDLWLRWEAEVAKVITTVKVSVVYAEYFMGSAIHQMMLPGRYDIEVEKIIKVVQDEEEEADAIPTYLPGYNKVSGQKAHPDWLIEEIRREADPEYNALVIQRQRQEELALLAAAEKKLRLAEEAEELDQQMFASYFLDYDQTNVPDVIDTRRKLVGTHKQGLRRPSCYNVVHENGMIGGQLIGDCHTVEVSTDHTLDGVTVLNPIQFPFEFCVPLLSPIVPPPEDPALEDYDFAEPILVRPYYLGDHPQLRYAPHAQYGGIKVGYSLFKATRRKVWLKNNGRRLCTNIVFGDTICPIKRLNRSRFGLQDIPSDCNGLDEILDATDVQQRRKQNVDVTDPLAVRFQQLGLQAAGVDDIPTYSEASASLEFIPELSGKFAVFDLEDLTQLTPEQAEKAYRLGQGKLGPVGVVGGVTATQVVLAVIISCYL